MIDFARRGKQAARCNKAVRSSRSDCRSACKKAWTVDHGPAPVRRRHTRTPPAVSAAVTHEKRRSVDRRDKRCSSSPWRQGGPSPLGTSRARELVAQLDRPWQDLPDRRAPRRLSCRSISGAISHCRPEDARGPLAAEAPDIVDSRFATRSRDRTLRMGRHRHDNPQHGIAITRR